MTADERSCLERLENHEKRLSQLMNAMPGGVRMVKEDKDLEGALPDRPAPSTVHPGRSVVGQAGLVQR